MECVIDMAQGTTMVCTNCQFSLEAWEDGNPYGIDADKLLIEGLSRQEAKVHFYHPQPPPVGAFEFGVDVPHLCLACAAEFCVDSEEPTSTCPSCQSPKICDLCELESKTCPKCGRGVFVSDGFMIS